MFLQNTFLIHNLNVYIHHYHQIWTLSFLPASSPCPIIKSNKLASKPRYYFLHFEMESCKSSCNSNVMEGTKGCQKNLKVKVMSELFKSKSKNKINKPTQPENETIKIMKKHGALNNPRVSTTDSRLSIFKLPGEALFLSNSHYSYSYRADARGIAHRYILFNCEEVKPFIRYVIFLVSWWRAKVGALTVV